MKVLCLTPFSIRPPDRWLWNYLPDCSDEVDFLSAEAPDRSAAWGKLVTRYPWYIRTAYQALSQLKRSRYDLVVTWESPIGIPFALAAKMQGGRKPPIVIISFNPGDLPTIFQPLIGQGLSAVAHALVVAPTEIAAYAQQYRISPDRLSAFALPCYDLVSTLRELDTSASFAGEPFIHASGRSSRDYGTLIRAVAGLPVKAVIHGRGYNFQGLEIPSNVEIGAMVSQEKFHRLVYHALFEVIPIQPRLRPAGSSQVVFAMMMGKPVVVTKNPSLADLVEDGVTGLLVEPDNVAAMREAILYLLEHPEERARMGAAARLRFEQHHSFEQFAQRTHQLLQQVVQRSGDQA